jgi:hypothetical protein
MTKTRVDIDVREIIDRVQVMRDDIERGATAVCQKLAADGQSYMRTNAPWTDRTSNARNGLFGKAVTKDDEYAIVYYHTMPYGIWLEVRFNGKYAIILPTLQQFGPRAMSLLSKILTRP